MLRKHLIVAVAALGSSALALGPSAARADSVATLSVTASVSNSCTFTTTSDTIGFGVYTGSTITRTYTARYTCTSGDSTYRFYFRSPTGGPGTCAMTDGSGHTLQYTISDGTNNYGCDGASNTVPGQQQGGGTNTPLTVGFTFTLGAGQNPAVGSYTDNNTVTITP